MVVESFFVELILHPTSWQIGFRTARLNPMLSLLFLLKPGNTYLSLISRMVAMDRWVHDSDAITVKNTENSDLVGHRA